MSETTRGSCLCQTVSYRFHGPVHVFQYCHCSRCRKFTGSAHAANIIVDPKNFEWLGGEDSIGRFEPAEARHFATCFCSRCGSSLPWLSQSGTAMIIPAGTFWNSRAPWREDVSALPQHDELPPRKSSA
jgi:hypothetical protein